MIRLQISRRYAEFSAGLLSVLEGYPDEKISRLLADMQQEVEHLILKLTSVFTGRKMQLIFLINNYDMILSIISVRTSLLFMSRIFIFKFFNLLLYLVFTGAKSD